MMTAEGQTAVIIAPDAANEHTPAQACR